jgi:hypothetical protein
MQISQKRDHSHGSTRKARHTTAAYVVLGFPQCPKQSTTESSENEESPGGLW